MGILVSTGGAKRIPDDGQCLLLLVELRVNYAFLDRCEP